MSASIAIKVDGQAQIERTLAGLLARSGDLTELMDNIGQALVTTTIDRFDEGVDPDGVPWIPSKRAEETGGKTLVHHAHLRNSISHIPGATQVQVGTNLRYARPHQQGWNGAENVKAHERVISWAFGKKLGEPKSVEVQSFSREANLPKRAFLGLSLDDREEIVALAEDHVAGDDPEFER